MTLLLPKEVQSRSQNPSKHQTKRMSTGFEISNSNNLVGCCWFNLHMNIKCDSDNTKITRYKIHYVSNLMEFTMYTLYHNGQLTHGTCSLRLNKFMQHYFKLLSLMLAIFNREILVIGCYFQIVL